MASKRRYRIGTHPTYDSAFDHLRINSRILNFGNQNPGDVHMLFSDKASLEAALTDLVGDESGMVQGEKDPYPVPSKIQDIETKIRDIDDQFENFCQQKVNSGHPRPTVEDMPPELSEELCRLEAAEDIAREEVQLLENWLKNFTEVKQKESDRQLLHDGPTGTAKLRNGILVEIAGQKVRLHSIGKEQKDILIISDSRSPYNGMSVVDYRTKVSTPYFKAKNQMDSIRDKICRKAYSQGREETFAGTWAEAKSKLFKENPDWKNLFAIRHPSKKMKLPAWPKGVKNYLKEKDDGKK